MVDVVCEDCGKDYSGEFDDLTEFHDAKCDDCGGDIIDK
jgi:DNA-directed RNA polymerase subunit RPC12/RpoP